MQSTNFKDLETSGFVVIPNFLNQSKIEYFLKEYAEMKSSANSEDAKLHQSYGKNGTSIFSPPLSLKNDMNVIFELINKHTNIQVDFIPPRGEFLDTEIIDLIWHQDHTPYYKWQNLYDSVTFWIPLIKPEESMSGLSFIPHNALAEIDIDFFQNNVVGKGAKSFYPMNNYTTVINGETDEETVIPFNINDISISPTIRVGDLLIFRGDIIHKTQDVKTSRLAISVHCANSKGVITKEKFYSGGITKQNSINKYPSDYNWLIEKFKTSDTSTIG